MQKATSKIKQYEALGSHLYYNEVTGDFSLEQERLLLVEESAVPSVSEILPYIKSGKIPSSIIRWLKN